MTKKKQATKLSPKVQAPDAAGQARREKEQEVRRKNAEKQKRFRENQKICGFKRVTLWEAPSPAGSHKRMADKGYKQAPAWEMPPEKPNKKKICVAVRIHESSLNAAGKYPKIKTALESAAGALALAVGDSPEARGVYQDYLELVKLIGGEG